MPSINHWSVKTAKAMSSIGFMVIILSLSVIGSLTIIASFVFLNMAMFCVGVAVLALLGGAFFAWTTAISKVEAHARARRDELDVDSIYEIGFMKGKPFVQAIDRRTRSNVILEFVGDRPFVNRFQTAEFAL